MGESARERILAGVRRGLQSRCGARERPGWVRFPHVPATRPLARGRGRSAALRAAAAPLLVGGLLLAAAGSAGAQTPDTAGVRADSVAPADTAGATAPGPVAPAAPDTLPPVSPLVALIQSMVIPGWGQATVGRPARGAVYFTAEALSLYMVFKTQAKLAAARRADPPDQALIDSREGQREDWIVMAGFWAFISGLDAWVSTHFWDFEPEVAPPEDGSVGLSVGWRVPLGAP